MKAITIMQPWAWAIAEGHKLVENRVWATPYRGPLAIHAGKSKSWMEDGLDDLEVIGFDAPDDLTFGAVLAVAELVDCVPYPQGKTEPEKGSLTERLIRDPFAVGPVCWILRNVRRLDEPVPYRGERSLFDVEI